MPVKIYVAAFMGQGGELFSGGVWGAIVPALHKLGCAVELFHYKDMLSAETRIAAFRYAKYKLALFGFSLGTSTVTAIQSTVPVDLALCVAVSSFERAWKINHKLCKRAVLWHGPGALSNAGENLGFDVIHEVHILPIPLLDHLLMPTLPEVVDGVVNEVSRLG